jgi:hypothetical protein
MFENIFRDIRYALRLLYRAPVFAVIAILTLTIGVTANATMFCLVDVLMFRPPAFIKDPDSLGWISDVRNYPDYQRISEDSRTVDVSAWVQSTVSYTRERNHLPCLRGLFDTMRRQVSLAYE